MEDYIFLIIAILISLFGALNKNKKKAGADALEDQPAARPSRTDPFVNFEMADMEDEEQAPVRKVQEAPAKSDRRVNPFLNFEMMGMEDEEEEYERKRKEEQARREREIKERGINEATRTSLQNSRERAKDKIFHPTRFQSTLPDRPKKVAIKPQIRLKEEQQAMEEQSDRSSYLEDFSLRKAVIYSIILERKY